jgi:serine protease Do
MLTVWNGMAIAKDKSEHAFLGINPGEITSDIAGDYGVEAGKGVLVEGVVSDSPADEAGLRENDIIIKLGDAVLTGPAELRVQLAKFKEGSKADLTYMRGGKERTVSVTFDEKRDSSIRIFGHEFENGDDDNNGKSFTWGPLKTKKHGKKVAFAGIITQELSEGLTGYFKVKRGALVSEVVKDSPAEKAGIKAGDVITKIGDEEVEDEGDVRSAIHDHKPGDVVDFTIVREGQEQKIAVTLGEQDRAFGFDSRIKDSDEGGLADLKRIEAEINLDDIEKNLKDLDLQLQDLPRIKVNVRHIEPISGSDKWRAGWDDMKRRWNSELEELRAEFESLKIKMRELREELARRMT